MSLNKWCGIGRMVKDPNLRQTQSGKSVVSVGQQRRFCGKVLRQRRYDCSRRPAENQELD